MIDFSNLVSHLLVSAGPGFIEGLSAGVIIVLIMLIRKMIYLPDYPEFLQKRLEWFETHSDKLQSDFETALDVLENQRREIETRRSRRGE